MLCRGRSLVKGQRFVNDRVVGHVLQAARTHAARGVDELMILDVAATAEGRGPDLAMIEELTDGCFIPVTVGGGVRTMVQIKELLRAGADKVCIGTAVVDCPGLLKEAADSFGSQAIVVSIDVRGMVAQCCEQEHPVVWVDCGKNFVSYPIPGIWVDDRRQLADPRKYAEMVVAEGAGEILLQSVERDGTLSGYDLDLVRSVSSSIPIPVIVCGGCSGYADMVAAIKAGASAVAAGALFQFEDATPREAAAYIKQHGGEARV